jgi:hypothetical protein
LEDIDLGFDFKILYLHIKDPQLLAEKKDNFSKGGNDTWFTRRDKFCIDLLIKTINTST